MGKSIFYRLFGLGKVPKKVRATLEAESIVVADEGMGGWFTTKKFRAPGKRFHYRREGYLGSLVITKKRIISYTFGRRQINIGVDDPNISSLYVKLNGPQSLSISFESGLFHEDWQGIIEFSFTTDKAQDFYDALKAAGLQKGVASEMEANAKA